MNDTLSTVLIVAAAALVLGWPFIRRALAGVPHVSAQDVKAGLDRKEDLLLLDVRTAGEFRGGHIRESVHVALDQLGGRLAALKDQIGGHANARVVVVCQSGMRAVSAAGMLKRAGLANVAVLSGGINAWSGAGYPVARG